MRETYFPENVQVYKQPATKFEGWQMSKVHHFQRYSSYENTVTNNFLQLLARIYDYSSLRASKFLGELLDSPVEIGIEINQQTRGKDSVPDGAIIQRSFKILVEAKVDASVDVDQLVRHTNGFSGESQRVLVLLTKQKVSVEQESEIRKKVTERCAGAIFKNVTYEDICKSLSSLFKEYENEMVELCSDFNDYCIDADLYDQSRYLLRIVPCGESVGINNKYGIYFQPSDRGYTKHSYVGIYSGKTVQCIWKIDSVFDVEFQDGQLKKTLIQGRNIGDYDHKILSIIAEAKSVCGYEIASGHRFFCGHPILTDYVKSSPYGIQGARLINLREVFQGEVDSPEFIAEKLRSITWK